MKDGSHVRLWHGCDICIVLHYRPETVHCSTKDAYTSVITFLAWHPWKLSCFMKLQNWKILECHGLWHLKGATNCGVLNLIAWGSKYYFCGSWALSLSPSASFVNCFGSQKNKVQSTLIFALHQTHRTDHFLDIHGDKYLFDA